MLHMPAVSDLRLTNCCPLLICVRRKSISEPGNSNCIRSASMFDFSIASLNSTLVLLASFYFVTPKTPWSCRTITIRLARLFKQYRYHLAHQVEQIEIDNLYNTYQFIHLPFLHSDFYAASSGFGLWPKTLRDNYYFSNNEQKGDHYLTCQGNQALFQRFLLLINYQSHLK